MAGPTSVATAFWAAADVGTSTVVDGTGISQWDDQSGNGNHLTQGTAGAQPLYKASVLNGLPVVRFDGTDDLLNASGVSMSQPNTTFVVARMSSLANRNALDGISSRQAVYSADGTGQVRIYAGGSEANASGANWSTTVFNIAAATFNGASSAFWWNGVSKSLSANPGTSALTGLRVGTFTSGSGQWPGDIAEVLLYSGALSGTDRQDVEAYLTAKWFTPPPDPPSLYVVQSTVRLG